MKEQKTINMKGVCLHLGEGTDKQNLSESKFSDLLCADCGRIDGNITKAVSSFFGEYYKGKAICADCCELRHEECWIDNQGT